MSDKLSKYEGGQGYLPSWFDRYFNNDVFGFMADNNLPAVNVKETKGAYKLEISAPGFEKDDFELRIDRNMLTVTGNDLEEVSQKDEEERIVRREFTLSSFTRSFTLPENVDTEKIEAKGKNGILTIKMPKKENAPESTVKRIEIK